jgi:hypothetical protein
MTDAEREELIRVSINACLAKGVKLGIQSWGLDWVKSKEKWAPKKNNTCCALSCVLLVNQDKLKENFVGWRDHSIQKLLGVDADWVHSFQHGFDGYQMTDYDDESPYMLGALLRKELVQ